MKPSPLSMRRSQHRLLPDARRVITKAFLPGEEAFADGRSRVKAVLDRVLSLSDAEATPLLESLLDDFGRRHRDYRGVLEASFERVAHHLDEGQNPSVERKLLVGAYFTHEYSIEAAALFNPSLVPAPDQSGVRDGELRVVMSARAVGEGHLSSIELRTGVVRADGEIVIDPVTPYVSTGHRRSPVYDKRPFVAKLLEMGGDKTVVSRLINPLPDGFSYDELQDSIARHRGRRTQAGTETIHLIHWLASSNYVVSFPRDSRVDERVLFPAGPNESHGMEDARFVRFIDDDGSVVYFATYTAFDGTGILPQSIETRDFMSFRVATVSGTCSLNKGMALFPRRLNGHFAMLSRMDSANLYFMLSDDSRHWDEATRLELPTHTWNLIQRGNCGSPIETPHGWLVMTHGVGPMRRYSIGAMLLDLDDPRRVIADLPTPLLVSGEEERDGYVPNVVYSCGSLVHGDHLVLPYGFSDSGIGFVTLSLSDVVGRLLEHRL
jgi:predicted GH43/DUF377 family glycosyl hydrolase